MVSVPSVGLHDSTLATFLLITFYFSYGHSNEDEHLVFLYNLLLKHRIISLCTISGLNMSLHLFFQCWQRNTQSKTLRNRIAMSQHVCNQSLHTFPRKFCQRCLRLRHVLCDVHLCLCFCVNAFGTHAINEKFAASMWLRTHSAMQIIETTMASFTESFVLFACFFGPAQQDSANT